MGEEEVEAPPDPPGEPVEASWPWRARRVLARFGPRAVPALLEALRTAQDPAVRRFAAESLGRLGAEATVAAGALRQAARGDGDPAVRAAALAALGALEPRDP
jgi:HEAT repeat protein